MKIEKNLEIISGIVLIIFIVIALFINIYRTDKILEKFDILYSNHKFQELQARQMQGEDVKSELKQMQEEFLKATTK